MDITVALVLERIPGMVSLQWGNPPASLGVTSTYAYSRGLLGAPNDETPWTMERRFDNLLDFFPAPHYLEQKVSADCLCPDCGGRSRSASYVFRSGCLKRTAMEEALL